MTSTTKCEIVGVESAFPPNYIDQDQICAVLKEKWREEGVNPRVIERLHESVAVKRRHISMPLADYTSNLSFAERNKRYIEVGLHLAEESVSKVLENAGLKPKDISQIIFTTVTGLAVPSMEARLMNRLAFKPDLKRVPLFGLGCVAGAAGLSRAADYLVGHPDDMCLVLALELCTLTFQKSDISVANIIACGLFGDGAAAVLLAGKNRAQAWSNLPKIVDNRSFFFPNSEDVMGWDITNDGFKIILNAQVPAIAQEKLPACVDELLARHYLTRNDVAVWIAHPGGPKVIDAMKKGLNLAPDALSLSYESLGEIGNLSSASVLLILQKTLAHKKPKAGQYGILLAMGPAFCAEAVLLKW
jgi:alkylresorcinol/alkylpyrone synthase